MRMIIEQRWEEPVEGDALWVCEIEDSDVPQVEAAIDWLEEHAESNWGDTLASFVILDVEASSKQKPDCVGLGETLAMLHRESRYNEDGTAPGDYYGARYAPFDAIA